MNRNDVIDVLTAVAAADRRTVGEADVEIWQSVIGELPLDTALEAVRDHLRDQPDTWMQPGHVYQRARKLLADRAQRESREQLEARQAQNDQRLNPDGTVAELEGPPMSAEEAKRQIRESLSKFGRPPAEVKPATEEQLRDLARRQRAASPARPLDGEADL